MYICIYIFIDIHTRIFTHIHTYIYIFTPANEPCQSKQNALRKTMSFEVLGIEKVSILYGHTCLLISFRHFDLRSKTDLHPFKGQTITLLMFTRGYMNICIYVCMSIYTYMYMYIHIHIYVSRYI